jgi:amidase
MARSVADLALVLRVIAGPDGHDPSVAPVRPGDPASVEISGLRVAAYATMPGAVPGAETLAAVTAAARALTAAGATVTEATPPRLDESLPLTQAYWARPESLSFSEWRPPWASRLTADEVERSLFEWDRFRRSTLAFMQDFDIVLCPVAETAAPPLDAEVTGETYRYTLPYSLTGQPVAVVRAGTSPEGLPIGVQLAARNWEDHVALAAAAVVERSLGPWTNVGLA